MPFLIHKAMLLYKEPFNFIDNPLIWMGIVFFGLVVLLKEVLTFTATQKVAELQMKLDGIVPEEKEKGAWFTALIKKWTAAKAIEEESEIILDHNYDGIKELDNALPPWWKYLFYLTILFAAVYLIRFEVFNEYNQIDEYEREEANAQLELEKYKTTAVDFFDTKNIVLLTDKSDLNRGKAIFKLNCVSCHVDDGGGGIGPNLTDEYFILGGGIKNVFNSIYNGGRDGNGMVAWKKILKPIDVAKVASYVVSLQGSTPAKPKAPQGDLWKE
jgi:cytochrome c oxidase cbb3-type subunit 3